MQQSRTLRQRIEARIARTGGEDVFLTREFLDLGGEDQVLRALRSLVRDKRLVRLGYGVYGRAIVSRLTGDPILYSRSGFAGAARQARTKLGVTWESSDAERDYNAGRSTQVPVNPVVRIKGRFSRHLRDGKQELVVVR
ncbi:MAG: conjugal transfer protein [Bryobacterales bacterium]|nr:conjugal transfer protein [Bryobacterales bacterium]